MSEMHFREISEHSLVCKVINEKILVTQSPYSDTIDNSIDNTIDNSITVSWGLPDQKKKCGLTKQGN